MNVYSNLCLALKRHQSEEKKTLTTLSSLLSNKNEWEIENSFEIIKKMPQKRDVIKRLMIKRKEAKAQNMLEKMP